MPQKNAHPAWLKAMQNGSIGEARTKAFLLDRFWVLERSVDIEGADFIIQRRLTQRNLLDREPPRLGIVQAKFFGAASTTHQIHREYVLDEKGAARDEFFLLCHFGDEEDPEIYLLGAQDIKDDFLLTGGPGDERFRIPYADLYGNAKYKVGSRRHSLNRMEHRLELADFVGNRRFMSWMLPDASRDVTAILPLYREPIDNGWGDLPKGFQDIKKAARKSLMHVEEIHEMLVDVANAVDPLVAEEIIDDIASHCRNGYGDWSISISKDLASEDFFSACREHKGMVEKLRSDGLLDAYVEIKRRINTELFELLRNGPAFPHDEVVHIVIEYDISTFEVMRIQSQHMDTAKFFDLPSVAPVRAELEGHFPQCILESSPGRIEAHLRPGRYAVLLAKTPITFEQAAEVSAWLCLECLRKIFELKYGECG